jgi:hypothetical protein
MGGDLSVCQCWNFAASNLCQYREKSLSGPEECVCSQLLWQNIRLATRNHSLPCLKTSNAAECRLSSGAECEIVRYLASERIYVSKPNLFIGCSTEGIEVARILEELLACEVNVNIWTADTFHPGDTMMEALVAELDRSDYAILILTPDDRVISRSEELPSPRDNVVFEAGFFMGSLEKKKNVSCLFTRTWAEASN